MIREVLLETWFGFSILLWALNGISLVMLPQELWDWFNLVAIFVATSLNLVSALNVYLNNLNKIRWNRL